jgi:putative Mg2+ transporter-C (MgtC) family protein
MLDAIIQEFTTPGPVPLIIIIVRLVGAVLLCGAIGLEREMQKSTAGLRTNMLIGLAAAGFALITTYLVAMPVAEPLHVRMDPIRLVEAVTAGVAFLAAGVVIFSQGRVHGLTTGASMWLSGSVGLAAGLGYWSIAVPVSIAGLVVLYILYRVELASGIKQK